MDNEFDPKAGFIRIVRALAKPDHEEAFYACNDLLKWYDCGGDIFDIDLARYEQAEALRELRWLLNHVDTSALPQPLAYGEVTVSRNDDGTLNYEEVYDPWLRIPRP